MYINVAHSVPALFSTLFFGSWSDKIGRRPVMFLPLIGDLVQAVWFLMNAIFLSAPVWYLLIGKVVSGLLGSYASLLMAVFAYVSDTSDNNNRTPRVTLLESMLYLGSVASHLTGEMQMFKLPADELYQLYSHVYHRFTIPPFHDHNRHIDVICM